MLEFLRLGDYKAVGATTDILMSTDGKEYDEKVFLTIEGTGIGRGYFQISHGDTITAIKISDITALICAATEAGISMQ